LGLCDELKLAPIVGSDFHHANKGLRPQDLNALDRKLIQRIFEWIENLAAPTLLRDFAFPQENRKDISDCINLIMNTLSFRKLAGKTQVILSLAGPDVRTRLTHTIEVSRIAKEICSRLDLNADLAESHCPSS